MNTECLSHSEGRKSIFAWFENHFILVVYEFLFSSTRIQCLENSEDIFRGHPQYNLLQTSQNWIFFHQGVSRLYDYFLGSANWKCKT